MTKVKICGITNLVDAKLAQKLGARFLGFVFYKKSPRFILPSQAKKIISKLNSKVYAVGVFVNEPIKKIKKIADFCGIKFLQLHGAETPQYCENLRKQGFKIIKAVRVKDKNSLKVIPKYKGKVNAFLFDTYSPRSFGGTGKSFSWRVLKSRFSLPIFLSGGLSANNVKSATKNVKPYAVDISSSLERYPGKKDAKLLKRFFSVLKHINE